MKCANRELETSTGIFLPSTISQKDTVFPPAQISFLGAVKALIYRMIIPETPFVPFGSVVISTQTGKLLYIDPVLLPSGDLYLKMFYQNASLFNFHPKDIPKPSLAKFYLAPIGVPARYIESIPTPKDSTSFYDLLQFSTGVTYSDSIEPGLEWGLFQVENLPTPVSWPLELVYMQISSNLTTKIDIAWTTAKDLLSTLELQMNSMKTTISNELSDTISLASTKATSANKTEFGFNTAADVKKQGSSNVYPTPPDPSTKQRTEGDTVESTTWATPSGFNETWGDLDEELFGDEDEITEADFNFFDDQKSKKQSSAPNPTIHEEEEPNSMIITDDKADAGRSSDLFTDSNTFPDDSQPDWTFDAPDKPSPELQSSLDTFQPLVKRNAFDFQIQDSAESPSLSSVVKKRRISIFSPLKFNSTISEVIDQKYSRGGRFFVSDDESEEDEEEQYETNHAEISEDRGTNLLPLKNEGPIDGLPTPDPLTNVILSLQDASTPDWLNMGKQKEEGSESTTSTSEWLHLFTVPTPTSKDNFSIFLGNPGTRMEESGDFDDIIATLVEQIVWDDELFEDMVPSIVGLEQPDQPIISLVTNVFPSLCKLSLLDAIHISDAPPVDDTSASKSLPGDESGQESLPRADGKNIAQPPERPKSAINAKADEDLIFSLPPPHFSFIRMDQVLKARTPILRFWKVFGLNPRFGQKNITSIFLHPAGEGIDNLCQSFLGMFKSSYESCGLGDVELASFSNFKNGSVPVAYKSNNVDQMMDVLKETASNIGRDMASALKDQNIVVLFANPFNSISSMMFISQAFLLMKRAYLENAFPSLATPQLSFQIVPLSFFAARDTIIMPSQYKMVRFALNIYDKCLNQGDPIISPLNPLPIRLSSQRRTPAFTLARMPPPRINFKLTDKPSPALLEEDSFIHIAYSLSEDSKWLTAAWSDQWGEISKVEAFCLLKKGAQPRTFEEVCGEIWQKTLGILTHLPIQWRVALAKIGPMEEEELEMWKRFATSSPKSVNFPYFLSVDLNPSFVITGDINLFPHGPFQRFDNTKSRLTKDVASTGTPITPQRGMEFESPDTYMLNATPPSAQADTEKFDMEDVTIVDVKNDIYGLIFKNCVSTMSSNMSPTFKPLVMGYLLKPGIPGEEQRLLEVALVHCPTSVVPSMKNILMQYRSLASLSSFTGVRNRIDGIAPWHVEAVEKMQRVLINVS